MDKFFCFDFLVDGQFALPSLRELPVDKLLCIECLDCIDRESRRGGGDSALCICGILTQAVTVTYALLSILSAQPTATLRDFSRIFAGAFLGSAFFCVLLDPYIAFAYPTLAIFAGGSGVMAYLQVLPSARDGDWLLLCDADTGEGVDIDIDQIQCMATIGDQDASPSLRLVVNLPANALRFIMEVTGCGIPFVCAWSATRRRWEGLRDRLTRNFWSMDHVDPNDINHMHALMDAVVVVRDGIAAVTGFLDCGFVEQIADEVLADADCESKKGAMGLLVDVFLKVCRVRYYDDYDYADDYLNGFYRQQEKIPINEPLPLPEQRMRKAKAPQSLGKEPQGKEPTYPRQVRQG
eukprot:g13250.t1